MVGFVFGLGGIVVVVSVVWLGFCWLSGLGVSGVGSLGLLGGCVVVFFDIFMVNLVMYIYCLFDGVVMSFVGMIVVCLDSCVFDVRRSNDI